jgi:hypothetical protein
MRGILNLKRTSHLQPNDDTYVLGQWFHFLSDFVTILTLPDDVKLKSHGLGKSYFFPTTSSSRSPEFLRSDRS